MASAPDARERPLENADAASALQPASRRGGPRWMALWAILAVVLAVAWYGSTRSKPAQKAAPPQTASVQGMQPAHAPEAAPTVAEAASQAGTVQETAPVARPASLERAQADKAPVPGGAPLPERPQQAAPGPKPESLPELTVAPPPSSAAPAPALPERVAAPLPGRPSSQPELR
ncbi:hypothetical protein [Roseateles sp.]|uniref:hypothetical protein n=1 Tax=Roseateles sp. TaxID=1971397 RepID=UPI002DF78BBB|nr:hypothetical protein [Roseateles sp.]